MSSRCLSSNVVQKEDDAKTYIETILTVHRKFIDLINTAFSKESSLLAALDKVLSEFMSVSIGQP